MTLCKELPQTAGFGTVTYSITGLTAANIANGIGSITLSSSNTAPLTGVVMDTTTSAPLAIEDTTGNAIAGVSLVVGVTYTCA